MLSNDVLYHAGFKIKYQIKLSEIVALVSMRIDAKCLTSSEATNDTLLTTIIPATTEDSFKRVKTEIRPTRRTSITTTEENFN